MLSRMLSPCLLLASAAAAPLSQNHGPKWDAKNAKNTLAAAVAPKAKRIDVTQCVSVSAPVTDAWCVTQCGFNPPNCPSDLCDCEDPAEALKAAPVIRKLPDGPLVVGYMNWGECDQRVDQFIKDGGNVVIWFSLTLEKRGGALITSSVAPRCVQESVKRLKKAGLEAVHMISVGGWNVAHPDTAYSGAEWYDKFKKWNKAAAGPGFENGFDGIDWDLEGNDAMVSPDNSFTVEQLHLVANFSKLAKKDGYLTSIAPPQSYLDVGTNDFSLSVTHSALHWHDEFLYAGRNTYAPLLVLHPEWDFVSMQLYESWSAADYFIAERQIDASLYLADLVKAMAEGWTVKFSQEPKLGMKDQVISVMPEKLVIGIANAWSDPLPYPRKTHRWTKAESKADVLKRLAPRPKTRQEEAALANLRRQPNCAGCPLGTLPRSGDDGALVPGGGTSLRADGEEKQTEKALALWPAEAGEAYLAMPKHARARGFMFWAISFEGSAVFNGSSYEPMWFARGLQDYLLAGSI